ncbi:hypothetical protein HIM_00605 [Hirsutella minnesotensis 3608]|nr:hypothetical protein HIM_00605 [Hirsutella minnesotensis 3608]
MAPSLSAVLAQLDWSAVVLLTVTLVVFAIPVFILFPPQGRRAPAQQPAAGPSLHIYPVKSCRGIEVSRARVLPTGLEHDRLFAFAVLKPGPGDLDTEHRDPASAAGAWEVLTLRQASLLANVKVDLWLPDRAKTSRQLGRIDEGFLVLRFPWADPGPRRYVQLLVAKLSRGLRATPEKEFLLPLEFPSKEDIESRGYRHEQVKIWGDVPSALNMDRELPPELARYLGVKHRLGLFRMDPDRQRPVFRCAPQESAVGYQPVIDFHDAYPVHLLNLTSVRDLESKLQKDAAIQRLDVRRFRGNIILSGVEAYDEDSWRSVEFNKAAGSTGAKASCTFDVSCRTTRCKLPNVDPQTGIRHKIEPDQALRKYRDIDAGAPKTGCLGMQLCPVFSGHDAPDELQSVLEVGMRVEVLGRGAHHFLK